MKITVIVPTYHRSNDLARCLEALRQQTRPADEILVVVRDTDAETWAFLEGVSPDLLLLYPLRVMVPGVVAAMNVGLDAASGDIIAFTDDDAGPNMDWLERIEIWFQSDHQLGGIGGRDWQYQDGRIKEPGEREVVGQLQWWGRVIGDHHLGVGKPQQVDVLKGVNMAYRKSAIAGLRFDERMRGTGAQVHFELAFTLSLKRRGWELIYDPSVAVDHYPSQRFDEDQRGQFNEVAWINATHNETLALLEHFTTVQRIVFLFWTILIGSRSSFGLVQYSRFLPSEGNLAGQKWLASLKGRWHGWLTWKKGHNLSESNVFHNYE
jgi:glycosyltransferase involved in cell wall biosynthesis